jgi:aspartyl-tRNA(Asn)/glutamyl-tRNA(Gln) amidotransferase subunit A
MVDLQARIHAGQITAQHALQAQIQHADALRSQVACVVDALPLTAPYQGLLSGIALSHKDIFDLQDWRPGCGVGRGTSLPGVKPAAAIMALEAAGATQWASLVMAPYACGATAQNPHFERCLNPLDSTAAVGGSSSGSAVAVAAGMTYAALGTDTAGSIRIPAACCGLIGLKTTHGAISTQGCQPLAPSLDSVGVLSRYAEDARQIWQALCPHLPRSQVKRAQTKSATRCQLWLPKMGLEPEISDAIGDWAVQHLSVESIDMQAEFEQLSRHAQRVLFFETARTHHAALLAGHADPAVQTIGLLGLAIPKDWYEASLAMRAALLDQFVTRHFGAFNFLILPSLARPIPDWQQVELGHPSFERSHLEAMYVLMGFVNYLGLPALNLPIARDARQRPICVQVLARPFAEHLLLDFAAQFEMKDRTL